MTVCGSDSNLDMRKNKIIAALTNLVTHQLANDKIEKDSDNTITNSEKKTSSIELCLITLKRLCNCHLKYLSINFL